MSFEDIYSHLDKSEDRLSDVSAASDVFNRQFGSELARWELNLQQQFKHRLSGGGYRYHGFVRYTSDKFRILLTPSPWLVEGVFVQLPDDVEPPNEGARIEVTGKRVAFPDYLERNKPSPAAILAESFEQSTEDYLADIHPPMNLKGLSRLLFENVGMAEASKQVFARLFVSSPPFQESIGGLTAGIQAIASKPQVQRLMRFMRQILPATFRGKWAETRNVSGIRVSTPRIWRLDIGHPGKKGMEELCVSRQDRSGFREVSLGALTTQETAALPDVPIALASEDFWIETTNPSHLRLPILKSAITFQMMTPVISKRSIESSTRHILSKLEGLRESFGLDDSAFARGHILDADAYGRPLGAIRLARSTARAYWKDKIATADIKRSWDRVLEPALKEFMELTQLKSETERDWGKDRPIHRFNTKVLRALKKLDTGASGFLGPTLDEIAAEAGVERYVAAEALEKMKDSGVLYEPRVGHYRLV
ncbi:MAG: hypothetical protein ACFFFC_09185 [Candidatus Thorarchaeota archaeon]